MTTTAGNKCEIGITLSASGFLTNATLSFGNTGECVSNMTFLKPSNLEFSSSEYLVLNLWFCLIFASESYSLKKCSCNLKFCSNLN